MNRSDPVILLSYYGTKNRSLWFLVTGSILSDLILTIFITEVQPQLSPDLLNIMEQRLSAIEYRTACLNNLLNKVLQLRCLFIYLSLFFLFF